MTSNDPIHDSSRFGAHAKIRKLAGGGAAALVLVLAACSSDNKTDAGTASCADAGLAAPGPADTHCVDTSGQPIKQATDPASCLAGAGDDGGGMGGDDGGGMGDDGGADAADIGNCGDPAFGATMFGTQSGDDDCKYDVTWSATPLCENQPVTFTVKATRRIDGAPATGANVMPDVVLNCNHPAGGQPLANSPESPPGTYKVGPVIFDKAGRWVVRFHFYEQTSTGAACSDALPTSPHGHAAYWVDIP